MAEPYANLIFDQYYRQSDELEDKLSRYESWAMNALDRVIATGIIGAAERVDLAYFLALQSCRYPQKFASRLDLGKLLAIAIGDASKFSDANTLNRHLLQSGFLPGAAISDAEFQSLLKVPKIQLAAELDEILMAHGYEAYFNKGLVLDAALPLAEMLLGFDWDLIVSAMPTFILSDRPMPSDRIGNAFAVGLSASYALKCRLPAMPVNANPIVARAATANDVQEVNSEVRGRAYEWICGPDAAVHGM
jgi:hypothetical protein